MARRDFDGDEVSKALEKEGWTPQPRQVGIETATTPAGRPQRRNATTLKQFLTKRIRQLWHRYRSHLPRGVRQGFIAAKDYYVSQQHSVWQSMIVGIRTAHQTQPGSTFANDPTFDLRAFDKAPSHEPAGDLKQAEKASSDRSGDGMPDYPRTRPQLAFDYLAGLVRWLADSDYKVISYNDLATQAEYGEEQEEFRRWIQQATEAHEKAILLQYDVDARPDITHRLMETHIACGVPANVMVFRQKIFDWKLKRQGILEIDETYDLDFRLFDEFQKIGGVIGYHCNAFDRSGENMDRAVEIFHEDVEALRKHVDLKFFSMHGGHVTHDGRCNALISIVPHLKDLGLTWVHNGHSVYFHANWADGSASNPRYRNESSDLLDFILSTNTGQRSRLLFHPQYYNDTTNTRFEFPILKDQLWVCRTRETVEKGEFDGKRYWEQRYATGRTSIMKFKELFEAHEEEHPVFINGMSRSGTTLLVSMIDAHPQGAMAYESYPRYLYEPADDGVLTVEEYIFAYQTLMNYPDNEAFRLLNRSPLKNLMRFAAVTNWTGMSTQETGELLRAYLVEIHRVPDAKEALKIVAASARFKVRAEGANFWGTKCQGNFNDYFELWPKARLIYIMRNGLDILASQKTNGSFNPDPAKLGRNWRAHHDKFMKFRGENPDCATALVNYERLVSDPEGTMRKLCEEIGVNYHPQMIRQHEVETTLAKNPRGQLSAERVQQPIDKSAINRWKTILTKDEVDTFLNASGGKELFEQYGLEWTI